MDTLSLTQAFRHSYTREFGSHHVNKDGSERFCIVYNVHDKNIDIPFIYIELDPNNDYIVYSNRDYFDNYMEFKKFKTKKQALNYASECYNNYLK